MEIIDRFSTYPQIILGFHGCTDEASKKINKPTDFNESNEDYEWLGRGIYFWENNYNKALDWAKFRITTRNLIGVKPDVIGAVIGINDNWIDFFDDGHIDDLKSAYRKLLIWATSKNKMLPVNDGSKRRLDCATINTMLHGLKKQNIIVDGIRGGFFDGDEVYPSANFYEKSHIQLSVRNPKCILELFTLSQLGDICKKYNYNYNDPDSYYDELANV